MTEGPSLWCTARNRTPMIPEVRTLVPCHAKHVSINDDFLTPKQFFVLCTPGEHSLGSLLHYLPLF